jgi:hypothetical protein
VGLAHGEEGGGEQAAARIGRCRAERGEGS